MTNGEIFTELSHLTAELAGLSTTIKSGSYSPNIVWELQALADKIKKVSYILMKLQRGGK